MCSVEYDADIPLVLPKTQLPPTRSDFSKQSNVEAALVQRLDGGDAGGAGADHADGREVVIAGKRTGKVTQASTLCARLGCARDWRSRAARRSRRRAASSGAERRTAARGRCSCTARATTTGRCPRASSTPARASSRPPCARSRRRSGCAARSATSSPPIGYRDHKGRAKIVRYWLMEADGGDAALRAQRRGRRDRAGVPGEDALALLTYERDRASCSRRSRCWRDEPRALPRTRRRLGAARRPGRHPDGRRRDRGDGATSCAPGATPTTAGSSPPPSATDAVVADARARGRALLGAEPAGVVFGPSMTALTMRFAPPSAARSRPATRSSARAWTTTPTCAPG